MVGITRSKVVDVSRVFGQQSHAVPFNTMSSSIDPNEAFAPTDMREDLVAKTRSPDDLQKETPAKRTRQAPGPFGE